MIRLLFYIVPIITGRCGFRPKKRWVHPQKCSFSSLSPARMLPGSALQILCSLLWLSIPYPFCWEAVPRHGDGKQQWCEKHHMELSEEVSPAPAESSPSWKELNRRKLSGDASARSSQVEWSPAAEAAARQDVDNQAFRGLSVIVLCCLVLRDRRAGCGNSCHLCPGSHLDTTYGERLVSFLCPCSHGELSWVELRSLHPLCVKNLFCVHSFVINMATVIVFFLVHCFLIAKNVSLNPQSLPFSFSYQKGWKETGVAYLEFNFWLVLKPLNLLKLEA